MTKPQDGPLAGKACLVTGSTAGIGYAIARAFLEAGAPQVMINGRNEARAKEAVEQLRSEFAGVDVFCAMGDVTEPDEATRVAEDAMRQLGQIDCLVNSTGGDDTPALFYKLELASLPGLVQRGLLGHILMSRAAIPHMMEQNSGCIINIASDAAKIATPGESVIGAIMAGIVMFTRGLAIEAKRNGVRVNCITPSIVRGTPLYDRLMADEFSGKLFAKAEKMAQLGVAEPEDLAELTVFLASDAASKITGQAISVNGGISAA
ncbi:MAG: SDR family NAD(P)-dependent oxidoreductase [Hyphomicrobiaceae bacterium]